MKNIVLSEERWRAVEDHISVHNEELGHVKESLASIREDIDWMKWGIRTVGGAAIASLVANALSLFR